MTPFPYPHRINWESPQSRGLLACWPMMADNFRVTNIAGAGNGVRYNNPTWRLSSDVPRYLSFTAASSQYVQFAYQARYNYLNTTFAVAFRARAGSNYVIAQGMTAALGDRGWGVSVGVSGNITCATKRSAATSCSRSSATTPFADGLWHHVLAVFKTDSTTEASNDMNIYIDGVLNQGAISRSGTPDNSTDVIYLGRREAGNYLQGDLADVRLYKPVNFLSMGALAKMYYMPNTRWDLYRYTNKTWLFATPIPDITVRLTWTDNSEGEDSFSIERDDDGGGFVEIDTVAAGVETYDDSPEIGHTYTYRVRATSAALGDSEYSNEAEVTV